MAVLATLAVVMAGPGAGTSGHYRLSGSVNMSDVTPSLAQTVPLPTRARSPQFVVPAAGRPTRRLRSLQALAVAATDLDTS